MNGDDYQWLVPLLAVSLLAALACHARIRQYGKACLVASGISAAFLLGFYVVSGRHEITVNNAGQFIAWSGVLLVPGFLCGLCVSSLVGVVFLLFRSRPTVKGHHVPDKRLR